MNFGNDILVPGHGDEYYFGDGGDDDVATVAYGDAFADDYNVLKSKLYV